MIKAKTTKKLNIYIDLSNIYGGTSEILRPGQFMSMSSLLEIVDKHFGGITKTKGYGAYIGIAGVTNPVEKLFIKAQNEFLNDFRDDEKRHFGKGNISKHGKEKGVDMQLGVDMVHDAFVNDFDEAIIMTGDADFYYPLEIVKKLGKQVHLCTFATRFTLPLAYKTNKKVVLDYKNIFQKQVIPLYKKIPKHIEIIAIDKDILVKKV